MFESTPNYPDAGRYWDMVDKHQVNIFYTAPTAIRALMAAGDDFGASDRRAQLRVLGTVGEPINPEAWEWYYKVVGDGRCPIVDTWWQTETGGIMITPLPGATALQAGSATKPALRRQPQLVDGEGNDLEGGVSGQGNLCIEHDSAGRGRCADGLWRPRALRPDLLLDLPGLSTSPATAAAATKDGYYWITGRVDDVLNVSGSPHGHRRD